MKPMKQKKYSNDCKKVILVRERFKLSSQDRKLFKDLQKNVILRRSSHRIVVRSDSSEDLHKFSSEDLLKIFERKEFVRKRGENHIKYIY